MLIVRIRDLAAARVRYGYRRITVLLKREGWLVGKKRVYRIYKAERAGSAHEETKEACREKAGLTARGFSSPGALVDGLYE